jgi:hypothetical protein
MGNICCIERENEQVEWTRSKELSNSLRPKSFAGQYDSFFDRELRKNEAKVDKIIANSQPFTDEDFPANLQSLGTAAKFQNIQWKRISEIYQEPKIFQDGIEPNDIN